VGPAPPPPDQGLLDKVAGDAQGQADGEGDDQRQLGDGHRYIVADRGARNAILQRTPGNCWAHRLNTENLLRVVKL
jgi:hypothetical protein